MIGVGPQTTLAPLDRTLDYVRKFIVACQYVLLGSGMLWLLVWFVKGADRFVGSEGRLSLDGWKSLIFPAALVACLVGTMVGRVLLSRVTRMSPWYHPAYMFRDWLYLSIGYGLLYYFTLQILWSSNAVSSKAEEFIPWLINRGSILGLEALLLLGGLELVGAVVPRLYQRGTILPRNLWWLIPALALQTVLFVGGTLLAHKGLAHVVRLRWDWSMLFALSAAGVVAAGLGYIIALAIAIFLNRGRPRIPELISVTMALVGVTQVGKTAFLARAYRLLDAYAHEEFSITPLDDDAELPQYVRGLNDDREWPPGTMSANKFPLLLNLNDRPRVRFNWIDLPGATFEKRRLVGSSSPVNATPISAVRAAILERQASSEVFALGQSEEDRHVFEEQLQNANAVVLMFNANDLIHVDSLNKYSYYEDYRKIATEFYEAIEKTDRANDAVAVAIVVTQIDRVKNPRERRRIRKMMQTLKRRWHIIAADRSCRKPTVRVFLSSAVANPTPDGKVPVHPKEIKSIMCVEVMLWLASQVLRSHAIVFDDAWGFIIGRSSMHQLATQLDDWAN